MPKLSVVIPVYNEEAVLPTLFARLYPALDALKISYECVFVNDGSRDRSVALLRQQFTCRPGQTRVVLFHANFGQHSAVMAGLAFARGDYVVTLDADLQNPPEEIGKLVGKLEEGYDYVGTIRQQRQDSLWRRTFSRAINQLREWITPVRITDQGCMMRGYARSVVEALNQTREVNTFIPALASLYAMRPVEVPIAHEERYAGQSKYSMYSLIRLNFDLITGFSVVPLQLFSMGGMAICMELRNEESYGAAEPVAVLMLLDRRPDVFLARRSGAEGWLVKPLDPLRLRRATAALLAGYPGPASAEALAALPPREQLLFVEPPAA